MAGNGKPRAGQVQVVPGIDGAPEVVHHPRPKDREQEWEVGALQLELPGRLFDFLVGSPLSADGRAPTLTLWYDQRAALWKAVLNARWAKASAFYSAESLNELLADTALAMELNRLRWREHKQRTP